MLALTLTWSALLVLVVADRVQTQTQAQAQAQADRVQRDRTAPFLLTENMWPHGCVLDCQRGRHRAVCGTNGRLYKSMCAFQRAQCINSQLRLAPRSHCSGPRRSKCQLARAQALEATTYSSSGGSHLNPAAAIFVPECSSDGHFLSVQCYNQTGYCWCSTPDGKPISGTSVLQLTPNCTEHINGMVQTSEDLSPTKDEDGEPGPTVDSRKPSDLTAPPFWVTILRNSDPKVNRSVRRPTDSPQTCERERAMLLSQMRSVWQEERFIPECTADGRYGAVQCHVATGYCWCVRADSGRPLPGTSVRNRIPDCTGAETAWTDRRFREKPLPGCPGAQKKQFLQSLVRALELEAEHAGSLSIHHASPSPPSSPPPSSSPSRLDLLPSPPPPLTLTPEVVDSSRPEGVLRWHFIHLDQDSDGLLSEREARPLRQFLRRRLKPRRCAKKFSQYCDRDGDRSLTLEELRVCLGL
ncbi:SPARC-related modular calcium-binding protein 1-like isoform X2 [Sphaeramia orbicularis]|uniref:SPARC-related modular calcium-binding protein 1-like isoform X2 n=1 Tax=Sphaeramia orbicularis TaxID=375764 RepID=UPI001180769B|nr:SPARC-related modular calcium-binding protein 1-like isoform X2 [Sphaeramia orbicularis]